MERRDWLLWRKTGIGSSDAAVLHGFYDYQTPLSLYEDKLSTEIDDKPSNFVQAKGNRLEPIARMRFEGILADKLFETIELKPENFTMENLNFMLASYDAFAIATQKRIGAEIKFMGERRHNYVIDESLPMTSETFDKDAVVRVPRQYWIQIQHQYLVGSTDEIYFVSILDEREKLHYVLVPRDEEFLKRHIKVCADFWKLVLKKEAPKECDQDFKAIRIKGSKGLATKYLKAKAAKKKFEELEKELKSQIEELIKDEKHPRLRLAGMKLIHVERKGNVNYKLVPELKDVDLEKYRAKSSVYWKFSIDGEKDSE